MNERQLEYFLAVLSCGTFSGAAEEVGVSQSAVSQAISALEVRVGAPLFERSHGGVRPTPAGREFQGHAERAQAAMAEAVASVAMVQHLAGGSLEVACPASLAIDPVAPLVAAFRREFPGVTIRLRDLPERDVDEELLFSIGADIAITFEERADGGMQITPIGSIEVVAVLPRPAASTVTVADVLDRGLVTTPRGTAPRLRLP